LSIRCKINFPDGRDRLSFHYLVRLLNGAPAKSLTSFVLAQTQAAAVTLKKDLPGTRTAPLLFDICLLTAD